MKTEIRPEKESGMPKAIKEEILKIGDCEIIVCVLDDGRRIIESQSFERFMEWLTKGNPFTVEDADRLAKAIKD